MQEKLASALLLSFGSTDCPREKQSISTRHRKSCDGTLNLEKFRIYNDVNDIVNEPSNTPGIGVWTAHLVAVRRLHRLDYYPDGDLGLRKIVSRYYCRVRKVTNNEIRKIAQNWGALKGLAESYLMSAEREKVPVFRSSVQTILVSINQCMLNVLQKLFFNRVMIF